MLREIRQDDAHRFRFRFDREDGAGSWLVSLRPELPWIGRPRGRWPTPTPVKHAFAGHCSRLLLGSMLQSVRKDPVDRIVRFRFAGGRALIAELATHGANLVLLDAAGRIEQAARNPRRSRERLAPGRPYTPPPLPAGVFGIGKETEELLRRERLAGETLEATLARRLAELSRGPGEPVIEAPCDPLEAAESGTLERGACRLLPWCPAAPPGPGMRRIALADAAATAGLFHEALERLTLVEQRWSRLRTLVGRELVRLAAATAHARGDLAAFSDPGRHRLYGEALLAGLASSRVEGVRVHVPDPYAADGREIAVPVPPGHALTAAAQAHFERHRRGQRGRDLAQRRVELLEDRRRALAALLERHAGATGFDALLAMEAALRQQGLPVGLEPATRSGRALHRVSRPRLEGVRVLAGRTGATILVGKGARENDRLTFRLAGPDDLWFHALDRPGAHVVVRLSPGESAETGIVAEAAAVAAWYSDGRSDDRVDVQWTRRKHVRRRRRAGPGAVILKKFQTVRVRPGLPRSDPEGPGSAPGRPSLRRKSGS